MSFRDAYLELSTSYRYKPACLDLLNNHLTYASDNGTLQTCYLNKKENKGTKWRYWFDVRERGEWWIKNTNNRLIAKEEVVLDLDPETHETQEEFRGRISKTVEQVEKDGAIILGVFETGSRGVHIHAILPALGLQADRDIVRIRELLLQKYKADPSKAGLRTMIAIEGTPHWKTGKPKTLARWWR